MSRNLKPLREAAMQHDEMESLHKQLSQSKWDRLLILYQYFKLVVLNDSDSF